MIEYRGKILFVGFGAVALSRFSQGHAPSSGAPVPIVEGPTTA
jgi:hypothetical protein